MFALMVYTRQEIDAASTIGMALSGSKRIDSEFKNVDDF